MWIMPARRPVMTPFALYCAGGFCHEVTQAGQAINRVRPIRRLVRFVDDGRAGQTLQGILVLGAFDAIADLALKTAAARPGVMFPNFIHPAPAVDREWMMFGDGNYVGPGACLTAELHIGNHNIISLNAELSNDVDLSHAVHVNPSAVLNGWVVVHRGASILPRLRVGGGATVSLGAVVHADVAPSDTVAGNPARVMRRGGGA